MDILNPNEDASSGISRRRFIETASAAALGTTLASARQKARARPSKPPNILLIISDEHNARVTGCYGNSTILTPSLDELASRSVLFENCYTNSPLCAPSRLSLTSGKYCSRVGAWSNSCWLPSNEYPSIARVVKTRGYEPYLIGKMHYDATRNYGFTEVGRFWTNEYKKTGKGGRRLPDDTEIHYTDWWNRADSFHSGEHSRVLDHDRKVREGACHFLANRKATDNPFFLTVGFLAPHFPLTVPEKFRAPYRGRIGPPRLPLGHVDMQPLNYQQLRHGFGLVKTNPGTVIEGRECYYGLTQWCDHNIGQVLAALRKSSAADNTVIIYTSDHGENMGEHALWWKNCMYDTATHIPLMISWPGRWEAGDHRLGACSLVDVVQTIADVAGATPPEDWNGNSLVPWLDDRNSAWKDLAVSEYFAHNISSGYVMLRHGKYKYVYHTQPTPEFPAQREMYNLDADPDEFVNLVSLPEQQKRMAEFHALMVKEIGEDPERTEQRCRADFAAGYNRNA
ncbi:MAG TPA: sulfatase-like hydrolase/transferase [Terriglobia bacterium]|nr:sulfatase-like hydrolase/transferase [Terriglobia bacterium]